MYGKVAGVNVAECEKKNGSGIKNKWKIGIHRENLGNYATFSFARRKAYALKGLTTRSLFINITIYRSLQSIVINLTQGQKLTLNVSPLPSSSSYISEKKNIHYIK